MVFPTSQISLDQVSSLCRVESETQMHMYPPSISYSVQRLHPFSSSSLNLKIHIRGAECSGSGGTYFNIFSTGSTEHSYVLMYGRKYLMCMLTRFLGISSIFEHRCVCAFADVMMFQLHLLGGFSPLPFSRPQSCWEGAAQPFLALPTRQRDSTGPSK